MRQVRTVQGVCLVSAATDLQVPLCVHHLCLGWTSLSTEHPNLRRHACMYTACPFFPCAAPSSAALQGCAAHSNPLPTMHEGRNAADSVVQTLLVTASVKCTAGLLVEPAMNQQLVHFFQQLRSPEQNRTGLCAQRPADTVKGRFLK